MKNQNPDLELHLINTTFNAKDAFEILIDLLDHKINFHKCKKLSNDLKHIEWEEYSDRITALKEEKKRLVAFYNTMDHSKNIYVNSLVQLQMVDSVVEEEAWK